MQAIDLESSDFCHKKLILCLSIDMQLFGVFFHDFLALEQTDVLQHY
jgi:hypothetical protein